jgi:hypothetical protein
LEVSCTSTAATLRTRTRRSHLEGASVTRCPQFVFSADSVSSPAAAYRILMRLESEKAVACIARSYFHTAVMIFGTKTGSGIV